nr:testis-expressed sequence 10 protein-like [Ipomoea batatas]
MSCPHLSRVAALRKSSHPDWFPTMILWVYDTKPEDYLPYLCGLNYTNREIEVILQHKVACNFSSHISALPASRLSEFWVFRLCIMLRLQLGIRQTVEFDSPFAKEYDEMQYILRGFYSKTCNEEGLNYGPFMMLSRDIQELSLYCLYYFSNLDSAILQSLVSCCLRSPSADISSAMAIEVSSTIAAEASLGHGGQGQPRIASAMTASAMETSLAMASDPDWRSPGPICRCSDLF